MKHKLREDLKHLLHMLCSLGETHMEIKTASTNLLLP